jgi:hypothetical protein
MMSFGKSKGDKMPRSRSKNFDDQIIDASPGDTPPEGPMGIQSANRPANLRDTKAWQNVSGGIQGIWAKYLATLASAFSRMTRTEQIDLIIKGSQIVTIGVAVVGLGLFYYFLNVMIRVFATPALLVGAWWVGTNVVAPAMITRFGQYLNEE